MLRNPGQLFSHTAQGAVGAVGAVVLGLRLAAINPSVSASALAIPQPVLTPSLPDSDCALLPLRGCDASVHSLMGGQWISSRILVALPPFIWEEPLRPSG